jgi:hypothetical protein
VVYRSPVVVRRPAPAWGNRHWDPRDRTAHWNHGR